MKRIVSALAIALIVGVGPYAGGALLYAPTAAAGPSKIESTIFTYDGKDFIRKYTTLSTEEGKSGVNTKLDRDNPGYKALIQKRSYTGEVSLFGEKCDANYAPLTDQDGQLTGAIMVCIKK